MDNSTNDERNQVRAIALFKVVIYIIIGPPIGVGAFLFGAGAYELWIQTAMFSQWAQVGGQMVFVAVLLGTAAISCCVCARDYVVAVITGKEAARGKVRRFFEARMGFPDPGPPPDRLR